MPKFNEVFSTTWKVLLALFLISLGLGLAYLIMGGIGAASRRGGGSYDAELTPIYIKSADAKHTKMPQTRWNFVINAAIKQHCPVEGMPQAGSGKCSRKGEQDTLRWEYLAV
jgi:hypothetical protein